MASEQQRQRQQQLHEFHRPRQHFGLPAAADVAAAIDADMANTTPPQHPATDLFGFGGVGLGNMNSLHAVHAQMGSAEAADSAAMMPSFLDGTDFTFDPRLDAMPMALDVPDTDMTMAQAFPQLPVTQQPSMLQQQAPQNQIQPQTLQPPPPSEDNVPGAGPPPNTAFGPQTGVSGTSGSNSVTDFTKRRNWPAKVVEELRDLQQILDAHGRITHVSASINALTGYTADEVVGLFLRDLLHQDDVGLFVSELNEAIASGNMLRLFYRLRTKDGSYTIFESVGHAHIAEAKFAPNPNNQSPFCQAVFMMSRPYPTKNTNLLDTFLEHKIENERLQRRIAQLKREEIDETDEMHRQWRQSQEGRSDITPSEDTMLSSAATNPVIGGGQLYYPDGSMPPPERPGAAAAGVAMHNLTRENLEGITTGRPEAITDKMARYEGATHVDTIEMLTGLRYQEGERSRGITTGNGSPTLIKGDAGIAIPVDRDPRTGEKKKKIKVSEEYVCTDCGTLESPEWRKGPSGPKTLCNACGLRWAKKEKKRSTGGPAA